MKALLKTEAIEYVEDALRQHSSWQLAQYSFFPVTAIMSVLLSVCFGFLSVISNSKSCVTEKYYVCI